MTTTGERFFPAVATFVSNSYAPLLDITRTATVNDTVADGRTRTGDRITYTIDVANDGNANSVNTKITDSIPAGTTYVPGSLTVDGNPVSDAANADAGEVSAGTVSVRLGSGAGGSAGTGGTLTTAPAAGSTTRITYTVEITDPYTAGGSVSGGATQATYADMAGRAFAATSNTSPATPVAPARADLAVTQTTSPAVIQRGTPAGVTWTATVTNNGPDTETAPRLVETLPAGVTGVSVVGATCTNSGTTYTCSVVGLASGASKSVAFTATVPATGADPTLAGAVVSGAGTDPTSGNNTDSTGVGVNSAPTPTADFAPLNSPDFSTDINVLANDTDPDTGDTLSLSSVTAPTHGTATIVGGKIRYTLTDQTFIGTDTFTYTACDNRGGCSTPTTVSVAVNDHRRADLKVTQTASPQVVQQAGNRTVTWTAVLTNQGPQAEPSPVLVEKLPADVSAVTYTGATCTVSGITLTCAPGALATGASATVKFTATLPSTAPDPSSATATLSGSLPDPDPSNNTAVAVVGVNRPPLAKADTATLAADVLSLDLPVAANDSDPDSDPLTVTAVTKPAHGTATIVDGKIRYTLTDNTFSGDETLTYTVCDNRGGCSDATVTLAVADHEVADLVVTQTADPKLVQRDGPRVATWIVSVNNAGPERALKPVLVQTLPAGVTAISSSLAACTVTGVVVTCPLDTLADGDTAKITFTATLPADGSDPATASASVTSGSPDPKSSNNTGAVSIALNTAPVADDDAVSLPSTAVKVTIPALFGDQDADGDPLVLHSVEKPKHGTATIVKGKIVYELTDLTFSGDETFSYEVCDERSGCDTAQITVHVAGHQHAPVAVADKVSVVAGNPVTIDVGANDHDADGGPLTVSKITKAARHGTAVLVKGKIVYIPDDGFVGTDTVSYEVCDSTDLCAQATATVQVTAAPPVVKPDTATVRPGGTTVIDVLGNDTDPAGYPLGSLKILGQPAGGTATVKGDTIHYTAPKSARAGIVTIRYQVCNKTGACSEGVVALTIAGDPVKDSGTGSALAYTGSRVLPPLVLTAVVLLLGGLMTRGLLARGRSPRGRHKA
nr:Ig-like domain-containing protein [Kineosporia mesophila]